MPEAFYNIHDLVLVKVSGPANRFFAVDKEYAHYRVAAPGAGREPDIVFDMHPFAPPRFAGARTVHKKFQLGDGTIYAADRYKVAFWKVLIEGLGEKQTRVRFAGNRWSMIIVVKIFLETLIRLRFGLMGKPMIHSSCLTDGEQGFVLAASPSTGKTTTMLNWLAAGHPFVSDEHTILDDDGVWGYVTPFRFHAHNLKMNPLLRDLPAAAKRQIRLRTFLLRLTRGYADVTYNIGIDRALPALPVIARAPLTALFVITRAAVAAPAVVDDDRERILTKLQTINYFEFREFNDYLRAFAYVHPQSAVAQYYDIEREHFRRILAPRPCREIVVPEKFTPATYEQLMALLYRSAGA